MNSPKLPLTLVARVPGLRALAWSGRDLYASRGYELLYARVEDARHITWSQLHTLQRVCFVTDFTRSPFFHPVQSSELFPARSSRCDRANPNSARPTRLSAAHVLFTSTPTPGGAVYWGEYFDNAQRNEVHIYASADVGSTWSIAYTFPKGAIRHVHNIVHDPWGDCLWILTGDYGDECRVVRASCDFSRVEIVMQGNQNPKVLYRLYKNRSPRNSCAVQMSCSVA